MTGENTADQLHQTVYDTLQSWSPEYRNPSKFELKADLQSELETAVQGGASSFLDSIFGGHDHEVTVDHGYYEVDVAVDTAIGIEFIVNFSDGQSSAVNSRLADLRKEFEFVLLCVCGVEDEVGYQKLSRSLSDRFGDETLAEVALVRKR